MSSSSSSAAPAASDSVSERQPLTPSASNSRPFFTLTASSAAANLASASSIPEPSTSVTNLTLFAQYPLGTALISQTQPRLQGVVVAHHTTAAGSPLLSLLQTGFFNRATHEWVPPRLRERYINRLPHQQQPPDHSFEDVSYVQAQLLRIVKENPHRQVTAQDFDCLVHQLSAQASLPPPPPILMDTSSEAAYAPVARHSSSSLVHRPVDPGLAVLSRRHTISASPAQPPPFSVVPGSPRLPATDLARTVEELTQKIADIDLFVRSQHSAARSRSQNQSAPSILPPQPSPTPVVPGLPPVHPQLLVDCSSREPSRSRSRSRSHSRHHYAAVRQYAQIYVPCPFQDSRQAMTPAARAKSSASMRKLYRNVLRDIYSFHPLAAKAAADILLTSQTPTYRPPTWEEQQLLNYANLLDLFLLQANSGLWTLWSEPGIDWLVRSFLEMAVRVHPKKEPPEFVDPYLAGRVRRLKYVDNKKFGPVSAANNTQKLFNRKNQQPGKQTSAGVLGASPAVSQPLNNFQRRATAQQSVPQPNNT